MLLLTRHRSAFRSSTALQLGLISDRVPSSTAARMYLLGSAIFVCGGLTLLALLLSSSVFLTGYNGERLSACRGSSLWRLREEKMQTEGA